MHWGLVPQQYELLLFPAPTGLSLKVCVVLG